MSLLLGGGGLKHRIKIPQQDFALKRQGGGGGGGAYARGGAYLRDTRVYAIISIFLQYPESTHLLITETSIHYEK